MEERRGASEEEGRERGKRAKAEERKRGAENEAGEGRERYVNVERQIESRKEESGKWSRCGKCKRAKERINKQLAILSCTPVCLRHHANALRLGSDH